ncbi:hypothetical protein [Chryseobacterium jejuense]|uniref:Uncharacterized protein n=1 Tax=Chryseobacterium jejuense TaxID=445960 RepID=A0A2X2Z906_CHRJE|nr:hypothetical protein [Chryseobacterium jejuense]SDJ56644.1 hypothetical protein SAMN05421542_3827 [Chryseobacterium jejuense]SQB46179.1 Uncharacterised protein [Chryseobacterium jejuense]
MPVIIEIKTRTNWLITLIMGLALIVCLFIILILMPLMSIEETYFLSIFSYITKVIPFAAFFTLFLYFWLWNTFGKTVISIKPDSIRVRYKNKLFTSSKTFLKQEIKDIQTIDFRIEKTQLGTRYHFSWVDATYSVVLMNKDGEIRIINWVTKENADEIIGKIKKIWN